LTALRIGLQFERDFAAARLMIDEQGLLIVEVCLRVEVTIGLNRFL
jgi:hypothetical protein